MSTCTYLKLYSNGLFLVVSNKSMYYRSLNRQSIYPYRYANEKQYHTINEVHDCFLEIILGSREIIAYLPHQYNLNNIMKCSETI